MITGAAGGIGSTLSLLLMNKGHKVYAVDNLNNGYMENLFENNRPVFEKFFKEDIRDTKKMIDIIYNENIEKIIHLAAITALPVAESDPYQRRPQGNPGLLLHAQNPATKSSTRPGAV